jgi:hypothetical protein
MVLKSSIVPQADVLEDVGRVVEAVGAGLDGEAQLGEHIGKSPRQGRYYRRAAELLGLLKPVRRGHSELAPRGVEYLAAGRVRGREIFIDGVRENAAFRQLLQFVGEAGGHGRSRPEIEAWLDEHTTLSGSTPRRRFSTVQRWLCELALVRTDGTTFWLNGDDR